MKDSHSKSITQSNNNTSNNNRSQQCSDTNADKSEYPDTYGFEVKDSKNNFHNADDATRQRSESSSVNAGTGTASALHYDGLAMHSLINLYGRKTSR